MSKATSLPTGRRRARVRVSVGTMMVLVLIIGGGLGWVVRRARIQRLAVAAIQDAGGGVTYDWNAAPASRALPRRPPFRAPQSNMKQWLVAQLGPDYFGDVKWVRLGAQDVDE